MPPQNNPIENKNNTAPQSPAPTKQENKAAGIANSNLEMTFKQGLSNVLDLIAPAAFMVKPNYVQIGNKFARTLFVFTYPRYIQTNWISPIIDFDVTLDIAMNIMPLKSNEVMNNLRRKATQLESTESIQREKGIIRDPELQTAISDIEELRDVLQRGEVRLFQFALYFTIYADSVKDLDTVSKQLESTLGGMLIYTKQALLQMEQGFTATLPLFHDQLNVARNLDTGSLSTTFPFTSATLTSNEGILYGLNRHNNSLVLFDRFNLENANSVIFATTGAGKSYTIKLEAVRYLMLDTDVIIIDPENEYKQLCEAVGGSYLNLSLNSDTRINPFDLPAVMDGESGEDNLRTTIATLHGLLGLMLQGLTPEEDGIMDKALYETYALKDITIDPESQKNPAPLITDLQSILTNMNGAENMVKKLQKYTEGSFAGLFTKPTNFDLSNKFVCFSVRDLEDELRPIGMYMILTYIWSQIRFKLKRRLLIIDEAWWMMQYEDSAKFLYSLVKRARKYYLGVSIISQDVEDFLDSKYGRSVISNAAMQILLKQSTSAIDKVVEVFNLTEGEKMLLLESGVGEGIFFAGMNHVAIKMIASYTEDQLITTDPKEILAARELASQSTTSSSS
ncbi:MAG: ATP-binding protein [Patescibacteria group bacterium]